MFRLRHCLSAATISVAGIVLARSADHYRLLSIGSNQFGQLGCGSEGTNSIPQLQRVKLEESICALAAGGDHACAVSASGQLYTWGRGQGNVLGNGGDESNVTTPQLVHSLRQRRIRSVSASDTHTCAVDEDGNFFTWGLGSGKGNALPTMVQSLADAGIKIESSSCGHGHTLALSSENRVYVWGKSAQGQLGFKADDPVVAEPQLLVQLPPVQKVAAGRNFSLALTTNGRVLSWGAGDFGQLGHGQTVGRYVFEPTEVSLPSPVVDIAAGEFHAVCADADGRVWSWGMGSDGQIGSGAKLLHNTSPVLVSEQTALANEKVIQVSAGGGHSGAVTTQGKIFLWGRGRGGQLIPNEKESPASARLVPVEATRLRTFSSNVGADSLPLLALGKDFTLIATRGEKRGGNT